MEVEKELVYRIAFSENDDEFIASVDSDPPMSYKDDNPNAALQGLRAMVANRLG